MELSWWSTIPTGLHSGFDILMLIILSRLPHNHIINSSPLSWYLFPFTTKLPQWYIQDLYHCCWSICVPKSLHVACYYPCFVVPPPNFNGGIFPTIICLYAFKIFLWTAEYFGDLYPLFPFTGVLIRIFLLMHSPHCCTSTIMWPCYIVREYHTPTSFFLAGAILKINIATIRFAIFVPPVVS